MPRKRKSKIHADGFTIEVKKPKKDFKKMGEERLSKQLLENLVSLQKVHTDLAVKFDKLSKEISNLLTLFEITARTFAKNVPKTPEFEKDKEFLEKIDRLLDQNKVIARGLMMMEDRLKERVYGPQQQLQPQHPQQPQQQKPEEQNMQPSMFNQERRPLPRF
jgi:hypothetical protein